MVHGTCSERSRDAALSPVHTSRRYSPPRPAGLQRPLAQTAGCHAHSPLSVRGALSRALGTHSVHFRYDLPGTAVLKKYKRGIHEYLNIKVCVCVCCTQLGARACHVILPRTIFFTCQSKTPTAPLVVAIMRRRTHLCGLMAEE